MTQEDINDIKNEISLLKLNLSFIELSYQDLINAKVGVYDFKEYFGLRQMINTYKMSIARLEKILEND